jgi:CheY-like chemotaxis protein
VNEEGDACLRDRAALIVDDNSTSRRVLSRYLSEWGMQTDEAADGSEALQKLICAVGAGQPAPLVLIDVQMPGMDGFSFAERMRNDPRLEIASILMMIPGGRQGDASRCRELRVAGYLTKPLGPLELKQIIRQIFDRTVEIAGAPCPAPSYQPEGGRGCLRVLLAEDNPVNQRLISRLLHKRGHAATVADSGCEVLALLEEGSFDLLLIDVQIPDKDGFETATAIRTNERITSGHLPIIAMMAHAMNGDRERCLQAGMDACLEKPIQPMDLFRTIETLISVRPSHQRPA